MRKTSVIAWLLIAATGASGCRQRDADAAQLKTVAREREHKLERMLAKADADPTSVAAVARWMMPPELKEISGLAVMANGRLLAHDDEVGRIYEIDPRHGMVLKKFTLGNGPHGDFESITTAGGFIYMLASNGLLYQFREGEDGASVPYTVHDLRLGHECEIESMAYEAATASLIMPCKTVGEKKLRKDLVIYRWRIERGSDSTRLSVLTTPMDQVIGANGWKSLHPSDMTIDPITGNYVIIASHEKALIELTPSGEVVRSGPLPGDHKQPEGVAITRDSILIISDEANKKPAAITLYRWRR